MRLTTAEREERLAKAINGYHSHNSTVSAQKLAIKHKVNQNTLENRIKGKYKSIATNGGLNKLLAVAQLNALLLYIQKQALARFPCDPQLLLYTIVAFDRY